VGVVNQMALEPKAGGGTRLSKDELVSALKQAKPSRVVLMGCKAGWTGLAPAGLQGVARRHGQRDL
jgi:hypothetical protein